MCIGKQLTWLAARPVQTESANLDQHNQAIAALDNFSLKLQDVSQRLTVSVDREKDISGQLRQEWESRFAAKGVAFENLPPGMLLGVTRADMCFESITAAWLVCSWLWVRVDIFFVNVHNGLRRIMAMGIWLVNMSGFIARMHSVIHNRDFRP